MKGCCHVCREMCSFAVSKAFFVARQCYNAAVKPVAKASERSLKFLFERKVNELE